MPLADGIGDMTGEGKPLNTVTNKLAHFLAGCAMGAAKTGDGGGCAAGAIGATVGEMFAEGMRGSPEMNAFYSDADKVYLSGLIGGLGVTLAGGDPEQVAAGNWAASNAAASNAFGIHDDVNKRVAEEKARMYAECGSNCTQADFDRIDRQAAAFASAANLAEVAKRGGLTTEQAEQLAQTLLELAPGYSTAESMLQLVTGESSLTGEEASTFWATIGLVPVAGGITRKVFEPIADSAMSAIRTIGSEGSKFGEASSLANGARLNAQLTGQEIAGGHAFDKHVIKQSEFGGLGIQTQEQFARHIEAVVANPTASRQLTGGRVAYWDDASGTVVIRNPLAADGGTAFQPKNGRAYFDALR
mgnify:CR=1 FL=1